MLGKTSCSAKRKASYLSYKLEGRKAKNKLLKLQKHTKKHPNDKQATSGSKPNYGAVKEFFSLFEASAYYILNTLHKGVR